MSIEPELGSHTTIQFIGTEVLAKLMHICIPKHWKEKNSLRGTEIEKINQNI